MDTKEQSIQSIVEFLEDIQEAINRIENEQRLEQPLIQLGNPRRSHRRGTRKPATYIYGG